MSTTTPRTRTITLTGRAPVTIREDEWGEIASAKGDSFRGDVGRHRQALHQGECDTYAIRVRRHEDGRRTLVYAVLDAAVAAWHQPAAGESHRGGELVWSRELVSPRPDGEIAEGGYMADIVAAIQRVGKECCIPASVIRECIADLPAEAL